MTYELVWCKLGCETQEDECEMQPANSYILDSELVGIGDIGKDLAQNKLAMFGGSCSALKNTDWPCLLASCQNVKRWWSSRLCGYIKKSFCILEIFLESPAGMLQLNVIGIIS
jgi:hypothetical protein